MPSCSYLGNGQLLLAALLYLFVIQFGYPKGIQAIFFLRADENLPGTGRFWPLILLRYSPVHY